MTIAFDGGLQFGKQREADRMLGEAIRQACAAGKFPYTIAHCAPKRSCIINITELKMASDATDDWFKTPDEGRVGEPNETVKGETVAAKKPETIALNPCPFCGHSRRLSFFESKQQSPSHRDVWVYCGTCQATGPAAESRRVAGDKWNLRTTSSPSS